MKRSLVVTFVAGALTLAGALAGDEPKREQAAAKAAPAAAEVKATGSISDADLSLYPGSVFEVPNPAAVTWNAASPGDNERLPRPYPIAPPRIPHGIADFVPLTLKTNGCLDCHALGAGADAPELPASHRTDFRNSPTEVGTAVAGARFLCLACHVPTSDAPAPRTSRLPGP
jgi:cytochrome c-type protein NapB